MEERIIDDEYARGIRLKKTKDGYVDATDELAEKERRAAEELEADELDATAEEENEAAGETEETLVLDGLDESLEETAGEEVRFEFPDLEEDDEDLVNLTPEEAIALRKQKEAEEAERKAAYKRLCEEGEELLVSGSFKAAELKFPYSTRKRVVVFGGHDSWRKAIRPLLPNVTFINREQRPNADMIKAADVVWIQPNALSHRSFYKIINVVRTNQVQIRYFGYASAMKCAVQVLEDDASDGKR